MNSPAGKSLYQKTPRPLGTRPAVLQSGERAADVVVRRDRNLPGNIIVVHGVNDVGTSYRAVEEGICQGLQERLKRTFKPGQYRYPEKEDKDKLLDDPDAVFFKRLVHDDTDSPIIPFYWGYRETRGKASVVNGQQVDRYGNRLDKDLSKGGGPFANATSTLPDMWNKGICSPVNFEGDALRPLRTAPGRMYMILAARRLAALIAMIRDYDEGETVSIVAHSQGCMLTLLAQAFLMEQNLRPADTLILTHPPYSLIDDMPYVIRLAELAKGGEDTAMASHYSAIDGCQTLHARLQTLINIVHGVVNTTPNPSAPDFASINESKHEGIVASPWKAKLDRDNRGKVYLYFCPEDMTVALDNIQGVGWQGIPDYIKGSKLEETQATDVASGKKIGRVWLVPRTQVRQALHEIGKGFYQRVFTARKRYDSATYSVDPVLVGLPPPYDFALRVKGEDERAHVESSGRWFRAIHSPAKWPINPNDGEVAQRESIRTITGEALLKPVKAELRGAGQIDPKDIPSNSGHAKVSDGNKGPCEEVAPDDAATAITANGGLRKWQERRPYQHGRGNYLGSGVKLSDEEVARLNELHNREKNLWDGAPLNRQTVLMAVWKSPTEILLTVQESPNEGRLRWQHEVGAKSFHGAIIGNKENHQYVTAYDVAIGRGAAVTDPSFYRYLCAIADWRLKKSKGRELRRGILSWEDFVNRFSIYLDVEPDWRKSLIEGNVDYYSSGNLPECLPLPTGKISDIVVSETTNGRRTESGVLDKRSGSSA
jgi:hypothetical protein